MKTTYFKLSLFLMLFAFISSCETLVTSPSQSELNDKELINMLDFTVIMDKVDYSDIYFCGNPQPFELWYTAPESYGDVIVYNNDEFMHIIYRIDRDLAEAGWGIHSIYLFIGNYDDLPYLENGSVDWHNDAMGMTPVEDNPREIRLSVPLSELNSCFGIATKVKLNNPDPDGMMPNPRAFLNIDGELKYPWMQNYEYCIQACD